MMTRLLLFVTCLTGGSLVAEEPWSVSDTHPTVTRPGPERPPSRGFLGFYQDWFSSWDGPRCPMAPTCSAYAAHCLHDYGFLMGVVMTAERLMHEDDKIDPFRLRWVGATRRFVDRPRDNARWWHE